MSNVRRELPVLPPEIWLRIFLYCESPCELRLANRALYSLSQSPHAVAAWLAARYSKRRAFLGALWWWTETKTWKWWLYESAAIHRRFVDAKRRRTCRLYWIRPWLAFQPEELKRKKKKSNVFLPCPRCGSIPPRPNSGRNTLNGIHSSRPASAFYELKGASRANSTITISVVDENAPDEFFGPQIVSTNKRNCSFELYQLDICEELEKLKCPIHSALNAMVSFAVAKRHYRLLKWIIQKCRPLEIQKQSPDATTSNTVRSSITTLQNSQPQEGEIFDPANDSNSTTSVNSVIKSVAWNGLLRTCVYLICQSVKIKDFSVLNWFASMKLLEHLSPSQLKKVYLAGVHIKSPKVVSFLIENGPPPPTSILVHFFDRSSFAAWLHSKFRGFKSKDLCLCRILESLKREKIQQENELILQGIVEQGYKESLSLILETFRIGDVDRDNQVLLFNAIAYGHVPIVKYLLNLIEARDVNRPRDQPPRVQGHFLGFSRAFLIFIILCDHGLLLFAVFSSLFATANAISCELSGQGMPSTSLFGIAFTDNTNSDLVQEGWCLRSLSRPVPYDIPFSDQTWWRLVLTSLVFLSIYVLIYLALPLHRILYGLFLYFYKSQVSRRLLTRRRSSRALVAPEPITILVQ